MKNIEKEIGLKILKEREKELIDELRGLRLAIKSFEDTAVRSKPNNPETIPGTIVDNDLISEIKSGTDATMFLIILRENKKFMKIKEMAAYLHSIIGGDIKVLKLKLSRKTRELQKINKIDKFKAGNSNKDTYWGSPSWLNNDGSIIKKYLYDESHEPKKTNLINFNL